MIELQFPTKFSAKGHFGCDIDAVIDIATETKENHQMFTTKRTFEVVMKVMAENVNKGNLIARECEEVFASIADRICLYPECEDCGQKVVADVRDGCFVPRFACSEAGGMKSYDVLLNVPSGKIVFANDLRSLVVIDRANVNTQFGKKMQTKAAASAGMVMVFTGDTSPSVVRDLDGLKVGIGLPKKKRLGTISTRLWWYTAMDHDHFLSRCEAEGVSSEEYEYFVIDVEPGVYAFSDEIADLDATRVVLSKIRKTNAPPPVISMEGLDAATVLEDSRFWKTIKGRVSVSPEMSPLGDVFCCTGDGLKWVNGCLRSVSGRNNSPAYGGNLESRKGMRSDERIPQLLGDGVGVIYPMSWNYPGKLGIVPMDIDPYWLAAGMMFAKTALSYPIKPFVSKSMTDEEKQQTAELNRAIVVASLDLLCEIAEIRGLWEGGRLEEIFAEIAQGLGKQH
jgi:hypothetical protein